MVNRILVINDEVREAARQLVEFASKPENVYHPGPGATVPGDNPNFVLQLGDYRCVFTITDNKRLWKHLSVSVPAKDYLPNPAAFEEIAHLFGITGSLDEWARRGIIAPHARDNCLVIVQEHPG
jgi:hypothetical protein